MDKNEIRRYILERENIDVPQVQSSLGLTYKELKAVIDELIDERYVEFDSGVTYKVENPASARIYVPKDEQEEIFINALWKCVKCGTVSTHNLPLQYSISYRTASEAIEWMKKNGFVDGSDNSLLIGKEEFCRIFGDLDENSDYAKTAEEKRRNELEERRKKLMERLRALGDDDDDDDERKSGRGESIEQTVGFDLKAALSRCLGQDITYMSDKKRCYLSLDTSILVFDLTDGVLTVNDCGRTMAASGLSRRRIMNILKGHPTVDMNEKNEIYAQSRLPHETLAVLLKIYSAIDAVLKAKK